MGFWLENPTSLVKSLDIIPSTTDSLDARLNSITRMVILITIMLVLLKFNNGPLFGILTITFIIIIYYSQRTQMAKESFRNEQRTEYLAPTPRPSGITYLPVLEKTKRLWGNHEEMDNVRRAVSHTDSGVINYRHEVERTPYQEPPHRPDEDSYDLTIDTTDPYTKMLVERTPEYIGGDDYTHPEVRHSAVDIQAYRKIANNKRLADEAYIQDEHYFDAITRMERDV